MESLLLESKDNHASKEREKGIIMTIAFGNDHAGFRLKKDALSILDAFGVTVIDLGSNSETPVDFPAISLAVCKALIAKKADRGILLCGTGLGSAIAANRFLGIRAGVCHDTYSAHQGVEHDDMNILCMGAQIIGPWLMKDIIGNFIWAEFDNTEDVVRRVRQLDTMDCELKINGEGEVI